MVLYYSWLDQWKQNLKSTGQIKIDRLTDSTQSLEHVLLITKTIWRRNITDIQMKTPHLESTLQPTPAQASPQMGHMPKLN